MRLRITYRGVYPFRLSDNQDAINEEQRKVCNVIYLIKTFKTWGKAYKRVNGDD